MGLEDFTRIVCLYFYAISLSLKDMLLGHCKKMTGFPFFIKWGYLKKTQHF
ncbi:MAG: hypothetical protein RA162_03170 [Arsenophonus sp.]|nr:MAG: hypothetical protein RA162_03170 [Arsenophonus sp.]